MPIYDYKCEDCGATYDVFHKVREIKEDIICPQCDSTHHVRLISAATVGVKSGSKQESLPPCGDASCCGGVCGMN